MLALYEQGQVQAHPSDVYSRKWTKFLRTRRDSLVHMYQAGYLIEMRIRFYGQGPQTTCPKLEMHGVPGPIETQAERRGIKTTK
jgi:hypothetical protein